MSKYICNQDLEIKFKSLVNPLEFFDEILVRVMLSLELIKFMLRRRPMVNRVVIVTEVVPIGLRITHVSLFFVSKYHFRFH